MKNKSNKKEIEIFKWLLEYSDFPIKKEGEGNYYWRSELRKKLDKAEIKID